MKKEKIIMKNKYVWAESISAQRNINNTNQSNANDVGVAWYVAQGPHAMQHTKSTNNQRGITLIALTVTIIVILILAIATFLIFSEHGIIEHAKMSKFSTEYREVQELVEIYTSNQEMKQVIQDIQKQGKTENTVKLASKQSTKIAMQEQQTQTNQTKTTLPVISKLTNEEKEELKNNNQTLQIKIEQLTGKALDEVNLYWIDKDQINAKAPRRYIIDIDTRQIYDYEGMKIYGKMWHTLDEGVGKGDTSEIEEDEMWDGWVKLTLYYPEGSTNRQWRIGEEGETRFDEELMWQNYDGPITVRLRDVENVWIRYELDGEEYVIAPKGRLAVDIEPDSYYPTMVDKVKIKIYYDKEAELKQYKIGNSDWQDYEGEFYVTENTIVEARGRKKQNISDNQGNIIGEKEIWGRDNIYVGNIGIEEVDLPAPTITRKVADPNVEGEIAKVEIQYPEGATKKIYKQNYGLEQEYQEEISVKKYGTYIIAYYYNENGKRSKSKAIYIGENKTEEENYTPNRPGRPGSGGGSDPYKPSYEIPAPTINVTPTTVTDSVQITIKTPSGQQVEKTYYKIGDGNYQEYQGAFSINYNTGITAYYVTTKGENSSKARRRITNIRQAGKPYVGITLEKDPYDAPYGQQKVIATITTQDANKTEYSLNGIEYMPYTGPIEITKNCRIYAKATNNQGTIVEYADITNIKGAPQAIQKLSVSIQVHPEPKLTNEIVDKAQITITYDERATNKYYKIGENGELKNYEGPFEITQNCTIYAYATNPGGKGSAKKQIDNLTNGISEPEIQATPRNNKQASKVAVTINFDRTANIKRYKINNGNYQDYLSPIEITQNCTITAYNKNKLGYEATSTYQITNIVLGTPTLILDKGQYYIIKLNYPPNSTGREYKWQDEDWKSYNEQGILLIKPEYKDEILGANGNIKIKIEDETGKKVDFTGDYYFVTRPIQELMEHISLRWDRKTPKAPEIITNTDEPTREVKIAINYPSSLVTKQYKIIEPDGKDTGWKNYQGMITITKKNTIIYAKGQDEAEVWSEQAAKKITNIDEEPPVIKVTADLENPTQKVGIKIEVTDDVRVEAVAWAKGIQKESYFNNGGNRIENNSIIYVDENGYYTIYAIDGVGNKSTYTLQIQNIDKNAPNIEIQVTPDNTLTTEVKIAIDYGDSTQKQYKIGETNTTWTNYTDEIPLTSYTVLAKGWKNEDNTVTIYAKGRDTAGNESIIAKKILSLDLDIPQTPIIESNYEYPVLTEYGVNFDGETKITYDKRNDIENLYSLDNGTTWSTYQGTFNIPGAGTIIAKSIKKSSGLEVITTKEINMPADALGPAAFDGNKETYYHVGTGTIKKVKILPELWGKEIIVSMYSAELKQTWNHIYMRDESGNITWDSGGLGACSWTKRIMVPETTKFIEFCPSSFNGYFYMYVYEIGPANDPVITGTQHYPLLTATGVKQGYSTATISYYTTSTQRLYKIDDGEWQNYQDKAVKIELGQTLHVKGIDKYGTETNIVSYTPQLVSNALGEPAYDGNMETYYYVATGAIRKLEISPELWGKEITVSIYSAELKQRINHIYMRDESGNITWDSGGLGACSWTKRIMVPETTKFIEFCPSGLSDYFYMYVYEISSNSSLY